jgi:hypothetical protein
MEAGEVIAKNYFALSDPLDSSSAPVDFLQDHWVPHWRYDLTYCSPFCFPAFFAILITDNVLIRRTT